MLHAHGQTAAPGTTLLDKPAHAIASALETAGWSVDDLAFVEIKEAFASVSVHSAAQLGMGMDRVNVNGGAVGLGHPVDASGARAAVATVHGLQRSGTGKAAVAAVAVAKAKRCCYHDDSGSHEGTLTR